MQFSPRRLGFLFFLIKTETKNQDWLMQPYNAAPASQNPVVATLLLTNFFFVALDSKFNRRHYSKNNDLGSITNINPLVFQSYLINQLN